MQDSREAGYQEARAQIEKRLGQHKCPLAASNKEVHQCQEGWVPRDTDIGRYDGTGATEAVDMRAQPVAGQVFVNLTVVGEIGETQDQEDAQRQTNQESGGDVRPWHAAGRPGRCCSAFGYSGLRMD
jgi:hypothetical protein